MPRREGSDKAQDVVRSQQSDLSPSFRQVEWDSLSCVQSLQPKGRRHRNLNGHELDALTCNVPTRTAPGLFRKHRSDGSRIRFSQRWSHFP
jgi:hypothetical protein